MATEIVLTSVLNISTQEPIPVRSINHRKTLDKATENSLVSIYDGNYHTVLTMISVSKPNVGKESMRKSKREADGMFQ